MAAAIGRAVTGISGHLEALRPDIVLLQGDRGESLAAAIAASCQNIVVAHCSGGDLSGSIDDSFRHAITKLAHYHLATNAGSARRILAMGEAPDRVFVVGEPALDTILSAKLPSAEQLAGRLGILPDATTILVVQHPVSTEADRAAGQMRVTLEAVARLDHQVVVIYPNADAGGREMIAAIEAADLGANAHKFVSLPHEDYLGLMRMASVMVGNSSSGLIEAPSFGLPVVNIGTRQRNRLRPANVIDVAHDAGAIAAAIRRALTDDAWRGAARRATNPYGDGKAAERIARILRQVPIGAGAVVKRWHDESEAGTGQEGADLELWRV
jgi:UDP-hydrolysing UDP-N-acetyl-D-glucosamine 2-epimerase